MTVQGGLKLGYCGLALAAIALLLRLVYAGPVGSAEFIGSLPFSTALLWLGRIGRALFVAGMLSSALRYISDVRHVCRPDTARLAGTLSAVALTMLAVALVWFAPGAAGTSRALACGLGLIYGAYVLIAVRVPWTCVRVFGHCHRCANAADAWSRHVQETVCAVVLALLVLPLVCWRDGAAACVDAQAVNGWRLPNMERGRLISGGMRGMGVSPMMQNHGQDARATLALENAVDELVFDGAAPTAVFQLVVSCVPGMNADNAWDVAMYLRSKTAALPRAALEKELFVRWKTEVLPGAPAYVWYDWQSMRSKTDAEIAEMIEQARAAAGFAHEALGEYERQRLVDLVRGLAVNLDP
ncbi:MAG: hypothetical protein NTV22_13115 [bacterium]|nr:hypothetical protein [bacterium]